MYSNTVYLRSTVATVIRAHYSQGHLFLNNKKVHTGLLMALVNSEREIFRTDVMFTTINCRSTATY